MNSVVELLGGENIVNHSLNTSLDYIETSNRGIQKNALISIQKKINIPLPQMAKIVGTSQRTLSRIQDDQLLTPLITENTLQFAQIIAKGMEVFEDELVLHEWLNDSNGAMDGLKPIDIMDTRYGTQLIMDILNRIEWGVYS